MVATPVCLNLLLVKGAERLFESCVTGRQPPVVGDDLGRTSAVSFELVFESNVEQYCFYAHTNIYLFAEVNGLRHATPSTSIAAFPLPASLPWLPVFCS